MNDVLNFVAQRFAEKTTWAAIIGLMSAAGLYTGAVDNDALITNISVITSIISAAIAILTQEKKDAE